MEGAEERRTRRTVTVVFVDLVGSTALGEDLDPEVLRSLQTRYFEGARAVVKRHGGVVEKYIGDAVMAVFGWPITHEDDALRAVRAAVEIRDGLAVVAAKSTGAKLEARIAVHTGPVVAGEDAASEVLVTGDTVNTASRLQAAAEPGDILLGPLTRSLARDAVLAEPVTVELRGKAAPIAAHRLVDLLQREGHERRLETPMVGRQTELDALEAALQASLDRQAAQLVTVTAAAGTGKSRLVREFVEQVQDRARVLVGRCLSYGDGITYWPLVEMLRQLTQADAETPAAVIHQRLIGVLEDRPDASRVAGVLAALVGAESTVGSADDIAWAVRRGLEAVGRDRPLVVLIEDLHWAEPALLDLIETVVDWSVGVPILIVATARPELRDARPDWGTGRANATSLRLEPLDGDAATQLIDVLPGGMALPADVRERIGRASEGNALYIEEMLGKLIDEGRIGPVEGGWRLLAPIEQVDVPESITALLAARIDGLPPDERRLAERGSVVGRSFERGAVAALSPDDERDGLMGRLLSLTRREILHPDGLGIADDEAFRFRHILIRDAAYERLSKADRAKLHARFADWLDGVAGERVSELVEILAHHRARAAELGRELGIEDPILPARAIESLLVAADRAEALHAYDEAARHLLRARALLPGPPTDPALPDEIDLVKRASAALHAAGEADSAIRLLTELLAVPEALAHPLRAADLITRRAMLSVPEQGDEQVFADLRLGLELVGTEPTVTRSGVLAALARALMLADRDGEVAPVAEEALRVARAVGARSDESVALNALGMAQARLGHVDEGLVSLSRARRIAEEAGDDMALTRAINNLSVILWDLGRWDEMVRSLDEGILVAERRGLSRSVGVSMLTGLAMNTMLFGDPASALTIVDRALAIDPRPADAVPLTCIRSGVLTRLGRRSEAMAELARIRPFVERLGSRWLWNRFDWVSGMTALWDGRLDEVRTLVAHGLDQRIPNPEQHVQLLILGVESEADRATAGLERGDLRAAKEARSHALPLVAQIDAMTRDVARSSVYHRCALARLAAESARLEDRDSVAMWEDVAEGDTKAGLRDLENYSRWRAAETAARRGGPREELEALLRRSHALVLRYQHEPIRARVEELAARYGIELDPSPAQRAETAGSDRR